MATETGIRSVDYFLTLTLIPKLYALPCWEQYDVSAAYVVERLKATFTGLKITLIAELTHDFNVHYHGIMSIDMPHTRKDIKHLFRNIWRHSKIIGFTKCEQVNDFNHVKDYVLKAHDHTIKNLDREPIVIDLYGIHNVCGIVQEQV